MLSLHEEIEQILSECPEGLHVRQIADRLIMRGADVNDMEHFVKSINSLLSRNASSSKSKIVHVKNKKGGNRRGYYRMKQERKKSIPKEELVKPSSSKIKALFPAIPAISSTMLGKAGEFAVVSKLLLNGYIANIMSVDDGIDVIASQGANVYFVQVKTSSVDLNLRCKFSVKKTAYQKGHALDVRYILIARHGENNLLFIRLTEDKINELIHKGIATADKNNVNISLKFVDNKAIAYHKNSEEALGYYTNNFEL